MQYLQDDKNIKTRRVTWYFLPIVQSKVTMSHFPTIYFDRAKSKIPMSVWNDATDLN